MSYICSSSIANSTSVHRNLLLRTITLVLSISSRLCLTRASENVYNDALVKRSILCFAEMWSLFRLFSRTAVPYAAALACETELISNASSLESPTKVNSSSPLLLGRYSLNSFREGSDSRISYFYLLNSLLSRMLCKFNSSKETFENIAIISKYVASICIV